MLQSGIVVDVFLVQLHEQAYGVNSICVDLFSECVVQFEHLYVKSKYSGLHVNMYY